LFRRTHRALASGSLGPGESFRTPAKTAREDEVITGVVGRVDNCALISDPRHAVDGPRRVGPPVACDGKRGDAKRDGKRARSWFFGLRTRAVVNTK
jgi:hypothetical protein